MTFYVIRRMGTVNPIPYLYLTRHRAEESLALMPHDHQGGYEIIPLAEVEALCEHLPCADTP